MLEEWRRLYLPKARKDPGTIAEERRASLEEALRVGTKRILLSHKGCNDGIGAVVVTLRSLGRDGIGVHYIQPGDVAATLQSILALQAAPRILEILDLSMQTRDQQQVLDSLRSLKQAGWSVRWRDHHHKQWEGIPEADLEAVLDDFQLNRTNTESGASLQLRAMEQDPEATVDDFTRRLATLVRDRDIWINADPDSELLEFSRGQLKSRELEELLLNAPSEAPTLLPEIRAAAEAEQAQIQADVETLCRDAVIVQDQDVAAVYGWLPTNVGLHHLIEEGSRVAISVRPNGRISVRSHPDAPVSHLICQAFGGGGHPCASGADLGIEGLGKLFYVLSRGHHAKVTQLLHVTRDTLASFDRKQGS